MRIFTPYAELPFAGHPSVGAAHTLVRTGRLPAGTVRQECGVGVLDLVVDDDGATPHRRQPDPRRRARAPGRSPSAWGCRRPTSSACRPTGPAAACRSPTWRCAPDAVDRAIPDAAAIDGLGVGEGVSVLSWDAATATAYARVFAGDLHWDEDPATGSAALGTGVWLVATGLLDADGTSSYVVRQGEKMGRPSVLTCTVTATGGTAQSADRAGRRRADRIRAHPRP